MSKATKRKHVTKEIEEDINVPTESQTIVQLIQSRGNNLHEVIDCFDVRYLASMPVKFRRNVWVKQGNYVLVEPIAEGDKVKAEIVKILTKDHIKFYRAQNVWPNKFDKQCESQDTTNYDEDDDIFVNTNRNPNLCSNLSDESSSSESSE
ncbi:hypothetical protein PV325_011531 [Microctonus aethiopoides]|uniref:Probable RNA-binding protein EIF1AD n=1 Tax=Microctonus aethiopoides TaxID=144406 RepID=A0AA39FQQ7_9HYME|nr:hypothetical protein PV325_011531 [Microctonus aethiopoides]KAK0095465.1 hypothetical protein PV326_008300 [Microctonus aethiopoides]KAK0173750.1 hypothetical protein PV328_006898 [Microctonus aethiopoides]